MTKKKIGIILGVGIIFVAVLFVAQRLFFAAPQVQEKNEVFTVGLKQDEAQILDKLKSQSIESTMRYSRAVIIYPKIWMLGSWQRN
jgi:cell division protein YceG involved in septum cleavage